MRRKRLSNKARELLYRAVLAKQQALGLANALPLCNICGLEIARGIKWHESHMPAPHAITGAPADGIAHPKCNLDRAHKHDAPLIAHSARQHQKDIGAYLSRSPMRGGRNDKLKRTMAGRTVPRFLPAPEEVAP
jgi:hypothetical protein